MAEAKQLSGAGLRGQSAGATALCTVGQSGAGLTYRGYDIAELADKAQFEEVAYLLLYGKLPNRAELDAYITRLKGYRDLPAALKTVLEQIPVSLLFSLKYKIKHLDYLLSFNKVFVVTACRAVIMCD